MAKKNMQIRYKKQKRERNKKEEITKDDQIKSIIKTVAIVLVFIGIMYLMMLGLEKLGVFEMGYTAPSHETEFSYEYIKVGTVFNRSDSTYYVLFDDYSNNISSNTYLDNTISSKLDSPVYKVDMSKGQNAKYKGENPNKDAKEPSELQINDITLIRINNGRIDMYLTGSEEIEEFVDNE